MTVALLLALVVALGALARERRRARGMRRDTARLRGRYLGSVLNARMELAEVEEDNETLRARLLLSTLRANDSTCAVLAEEPVQAVPLRREYRS